MAKKRFTKVKAAKRRPARRTRQRSGEPGAGKGMREKVRGSIYPASGPLPPHEADIIPEGRLGQPPEGRVYEGAVPRSLSIVRREPEQPRRTRKKTSARKR
jgi:hypothetical protein